MSVSLSKVKSDAPELVSLVKSAGVSLQKQVQKHPELMGHTAKCALVLDYSGSMSGRYSDGEVQEVAERLLALATQLDDDGNIDVFFFDREAWYAGEVSLLDYKGSIDRLIKGRRMGSTNMAGAIDEVLKFYGFGQTTKKMFGRKSTGDTSVPVFVSFITDGEPDSERLTEAAIQHASKYPVFFQFMGLGHRFDFLKKLDELSGRKVDNAGFFAVPGIASLTDEKLYDNLLGEYPDWVIRAKQLGILT